VWQDLARRVSLVVIAAVPLFFLDAPFRTLGQRWVARRPYERALLLSLDLNLLLLWVIFKYYVKWDPRLAPPLVDSFMTLVGSGLCAAGASLTVWGKIRLGRWFSATFGVKEGHELVTDGPYAVTRHPIYSGVLAMLFGAALAWNSALTLLLALGMSLTLFFHTVYEELLFEKHFGGAYRDYQKRVPRLVPFFAPGRGK
jgi:protein-S-isoprenylcysteine O-methyltransferase Ste14